MIVYWNIDPVLFHIGPVKVHWYGLFFAAGLFIAYHLVLSMARREKVDSRNLEPIFIVVISGVVIGARLAHCFLYEPAYYLSHPMEIPAIWEGGLASHGGIAGGTLGLWWGARRYGIHFFWLFGRVGLAALPAAAMIRVGNFFNSEILGKETSGKTGIVFARIDGIPRHPVMLYEAISYLLIFLVLYFFYRRSRYTRSFDFHLAGTVILMIFSVRFILEYYKIPQAEYAADMIMSVGQILSIPFIAIGMILIVSGFWIKNGNTEPDFPSSCRDASSEKAGR
jgi:prolipoprotein diacylglyceryl transferase